MDRRGLPGTHGDGTNTLSEAEDSVTVRKKSLCRQRQGAMMDSDSDSESASDNVSGHWEKHPGNLMSSPYDDDYEEAENIRFVRRSTLGGFQGRGGAESHDLNDTMGDVDFDALRGRAGYRGPKTPEATLDNSREYDDEITGLSIKDLPSLKEGRDSMIESAKRPKNYKGRSILEENLNMIAKHIARLRYVQRESGKTSRGIGVPAARIDSPPRRTTAVRGGVSPFANLKKRRAETEEQLRVIKKYEDKEEMFIRAKDRLGDRLESRLEMLVDSIARVKAEQRKADAHSGQETIFQRRRPQGYSDEESDFQPRGPRPGYPESAAGRSGNFGR